MARLNQRGVRRTTRPSGHKIKPNFGKVESGPSIPPNMLEPEPPTDLLKFGNNAANDLYTERCKTPAKKSTRPLPRRPEFFIKLLTDEGDIVLDPFAGSNTTGAVAERLERRWVGVERVEDYLRASKFRFE